MAEEENRPWSDVLFDEIEFDREQAKIDDMVTIQGVDLRFIKEVLFEQMGFHSGSCFCDDMFICGPVPEDDRARCPVCKLAAAWAILEDID